MIEDNYVPSARIRYIRVPAMMIIKMLKGDTFLDKIINPLPEGTKYIRSGTDSVGSILFVIENEEFDLVRDGDEIPFHGEMIFQRASFGKGNN